VNRTPNLFADGKAYADGPLEPACRRKIPRLACCAKNLKWIDVGCGNGAFTEMLIARCSLMPAHGQEQSARLKPLGDAEYS